MRIALVIAVLAACQSSDVSRAVGARCDRSSDCGDRCLLDADGYPGGFCTVVCDTTDDCPASDTECVAREGGACLFTCTDDASCAFLGAGWQCHDEDTREQPATKVKVCRGG